jgi:carbon storage regulator
MLVLTRKIDQGIVISGNIYVRVLGVERDRVKIGISAPLDVTVLRQELLDRENANKNPEGDHEPSTVRSREEPTNSG